MGQTKARQSGTALTGDSTIPNKSTSRPSAQTSSRWHGAFLARSSFGLWLEVDAGLGRTPQFKPICLDPHLAGLASRVVHWRRHQKVGWTAIGARIVLGHSSSPLTCWLAGGLCVHFKAHKRSRHSAELSRRCRQACCSICCCCPFLFVLAFVFPWVIGPAAEGDEQQVGAIGHNSSPAIRFQFLWVPIC